MCVWYIYISIFYLLVRYTFILNYILICVYIYIFRKRYCSNRRPFSLFGDYIFTWPNFRAIATSAIWIVWSISSELSLGNSNLAPGIPSPKTGSGGKKYRTLLSLANKWMTGWWFQTFFIFHNAWDNPSHWLICLKMVKTTNQITLYIYMSSFHTCSPSSSPTKIVKLRETQVSFRRYHSLSFSLCSSWSSWMLGSFYKPWVSLRDNMPGCLVMWGFTVEMLEIR